MRLELSRKAQADLADIRDYTLGQFGAGLALAYLDAIEQAFLRLLDFPEVGAQFSGMPPRIRSFGCRQHRIFYEVRSETILVVRVLHKAMDVERHL